MYSKKSTHTLLIRTDIKYRMLYAPGGQVCLIRTLQMPIRLNLIRVRGYCVFLRLVLNVHE